jgi:hypothetical protein
LGKIFNGCKERIRIIIQDQAVEVIRTKAEVLLMTWLSNSIDFNARSGIFLTRGDCQHTLCDLRRSKMLRGQQPQQHHA